MARNRRIAKENEVIPLSNSYKDGDMLPVQVALRVAGLLVLAKDESGEQTYQLLKASDRKLEDQIRQHISRPRAPFDEDGAVIHGGKGRSPQKREQTLVKLGLVKQWLESRKDRDKNRGKRKQEPEIFNAFASEVLEMPTYRFFNALLDGSMVAVEGDKVIGGNHEGKVGRSKFSEIYEVESFLYVVRGAISGDIKLHMKDEPEAILNPKPFVYDPEMEQPEGIKKSEGESKKNK